MTNAEEFSKGAKPKLEEIGPYVFDEFHTKVDLVWNDDNGTVTYKQVWQELLFWDSALDRSATTTVYEMSYFWYKNTVIIWKTALQIMGLLYVAVS